jgi:hypothetical protein
MPRIKFCDNERRSNVMARRYSSNPSGNMMTIVMGAIIVVVLALGVVAISGKVSTNLSQNRLNGNGTATVADVADQAGMEVEDYIKQYGLTDEDGVKGKDSVMDMADKLTLENFAKFAYGVELTDDEFDAFKQDQEIADDVTKDTKDSDVKDKFSLYESAKQAAEEAENSDSDDSVDVETSETGDTAGNE